MLNRGNDANKIRKRGREKFDERAWAQLVSVHLLTSCLEDTQLGLRGRAVSSPAWPPPASSLTRLAHIRGEEITMPVKSNLCGHIDWSPIRPDDPEPPICKLGHGFSGECMKRNMCPEYQESEVFTFEEVKRWIGEKAQQDLTRQTILKEIEESGVRIRLTSWDGVPVVEFDDGDFVDQTGALTEFLMHLSILMPNAELPDDLTIIPTKILREVKL